MQGLGVAAGTGQGAVAVLPARPLRRAARAVARPSVLERAGWFPWLPVWLSLGIGLWFALKAEPGLAAYAGAAGVWAVGLVLWWLGPRWDGAVPWRLADGLRLTGLALAVAAVGFGLCGLRSAQVAGRSSAGATMVQSRGGWWRSTARPATVSA